jgi:hypothetical protein
MPIGDAMEYISSVSITKIGNDPMPPGVMIMARVANDKTEKAAFILKCPVPSIAENPI